MPVFQWVEDNQSRSAHIVRLGRKAQSTYVKSWKIFGTSDDQAVHADVNATLTAGGLFWQYPGQPNNRLHVDHYTLEYLGDNAWQLQATYVKEGAEDPQVPDPQNISRTFDTTGATTHITQGIVDTEFPEGEQRYWNSSPAAANLQGAIGVSADGVSGIDVVTPALQWTETYEVPWSFVTDAYIRKMSWLTGSVNNQPWRTFDAGEVLFTGASGSQEWDSRVGNGPWTITYRFVASANAGTDKTLPPIKIGDIEDISKDGHDYLWVRYEDDVTDDQLVKKPKFVYVNRVYRREDFGSLGLG